MNKITIIGTGSVGSTIAYTLTVMGLASEIVMIDINGEKAMGEALDIRQGTPFCNPCSLYAGSYADAAGSNIVIITSGIARKPGQSRLELAQTNVNVLKSIIPEITRYAPDAIYVLVSNPVDVLTYTFCKYSGLPEERIIGSGTILDTSRLHFRLSEYYQINQLHPLVPLQHLQHPDRELQRRRADQGCLLPRIQKGRGGGVREKVGRQDHQPQGCHLLCRFGFGLPHLQEAAQWY